MIRENVLDYFEDFKVEDFQWRTSYNSFGENKLEDFNLFFRTKNLGILHLPTGKIVASDPTVFFDEEPFVIEVEKGSYDVILSIARINHLDERVCYAMLKFKENKPIRWEFALRKGDDISKLNEGRFLGYGVDSGTGCFIDLESREILNELYFDEELDFDNILCKEQEKNYVHTWDWINYNFEGLPNNNLIAFSSGWGDGGYASYFGFDENDQVVCLVTDFQVVRNSDVEEILR